MADFILYLGILLFSIALTSACLSTKEPKKTNEPRISVETFAKMDRESNDPRGLDFDTLARRIRDTDDPVVEEIMEQTRHIRVKRREMSNNG